VLNFGATHVVSLLFRLGTAPRRRRNKVCSLFVLSVARMLPFLSTREATNARKLVGLTKRPGWALHRGWVMGNGGPIYQHPEVSTRKALERGIRNRMKLLLKGKAKKWFLDAA
jgi:hypothetical protein